MNKSLTIVLPIHNAESRLPGEVEHLLEIAGELTSRFHVLVVDDGSTDDTYEVACELADAYPQVSVFRQPVQSGLGPAIEAIRKRVTSDVVMVHDGATRLDTNQVRQLWGECANTTITTSGESKVGLRDLACVSTTHRAMEKAHRRMLGFQLLSLPNSNDDDPSSAGPTSATRRNASRQHGTRIHGKRSPDAELVGNIPPLPRPNILEAVADFATGE